MNARNLPSPLLVAFLITSCSLGSSKPSLSQVRQEIETSGVWSSYPRGVLNIASFEKTNGEGDDRSYIIYFRLEAEVLRDHKLSNRPTVVNLKGFEWIQEIGGGMGEIKQGEKFSLEGYMSFRMTENGWVFSNWGS